jgi:hypothetical protein
LAVLATKDAAQMTACNESFPHPKYVLWRAYFEMCAANGYFFQSNVTEGSRYLSLAQSDLRYVQTYTDLPGNFEAALADDLKLESAVERVAEVHSASLAKNPSSAPSVKAAQADDPINLTFCREFQDSPSPGLASATIEFTNTSNIDATAVEVDIVYLDAFGEPVYTRALQKQGTFSPGVSIHAEYSGLDAPAYSEVRCYVNRARFEDGTLWRGSFANARPEDANPPH